MGVFRNKIPIKSCVIKLNPYLEDYLMKEITNIKNLDFKSWNNIKQNQKRISVCWGKTFFYYDSNKGKLYYENFSIFGRILRKIFGYKKKYNQENLWRYLTSKKIVVGESPSKGFRKVVAEKLLKLSSLSNNMPDSWQNLKQDYSNWRSTLWSTTKSVLQNAAVHRSSLDTFNEIGVFH